jgi:2'-5' RNA ligase
MTTTTATMELGFEEYTARQYRELDADRLLERAMQVRPSGNYRYDGFRWLPQPYPGFAVLSMVDEHPGNQTLPGFLAALQERLVEGCPWEGAIYLLPPDSFHQTVANMLSEQRFLQRVAEAGLEEKYPGMVEQAFQGMEMERRGAVEAQRRGPVELELIGISIFDTALGLLGVFGEEEHYRRILRFRAGLYGDRGLAALDVRMTRPFIGHITLAYIEKELSDEQRRQLAEAVGLLNRQVKEIRPVFSFSGTGLRRYEHLSAFIRSDGYPRYEF